MVLTPFTWRYGGREVSVSGSFNGWGEGIPLALIEGSGNYFQIIIDLPPGCYQCSSSCCRMTGSVHAGGGSDIPVGTLPMTTVIVDDIDSNSFKNVFDVCFFKIIHGLDHKFKFLVDGTWRVDEQQICEPDEHGTMYNVVLVDETSFMPPDLNAMPFQPSTNGNNEVMLSVGSSSGGAYGLVLQLSDGDRDVFRQVLSVHLLSSTVYELIPKSGKVNGLYVDVGVEEAFHVMYEQAINAVPLWNENIGQMVGMLTASDFILILLQLQRNRAMFANVEHEIRTISSWKAWKLQHHRDIVGTMLPLHRRPLIHAGPDESLGDVASRILQNNISAVPVIHSVDGSCPCLLHVVCLAGILRSVCSHFLSRLGHFPLLRKPIGCLPIGTWAFDVRRTSGRPLLTAHPNDPLSSIFTLLLEAQISSLPVVDDHGSIVNVYSRSDITSLAKDNLYAHIQLNQMTVYQALEVISATGRARYQTCTRFDSLYWVMELLSKPDVRRVFVVEAATRRVEGVITVRDIFNFFSQ